LTFVTTCSITQGRDPITTLFRRVSDVGLGYTVGKEWWRRYVSLFPPGCICDKDLDNPALTDSSMMTVPDE
jgi:hypothetical protein